MYTQCPECLSIYEVAGETLALADGAAACGHCGVSFNALATLSARLPDAPFDSLPVHPTRATPPRLTHSVPERAPPPPLLALPAPTSDAAAREPLDADEDEPPAPLPSFARHARAGAAPARHGRWALACLALALIAAAQLGWAERQALTINPVTRPWLTRACHLLGCQLPHVREPSRLQLLAREVRPHPAIPNALLISATIRNNAAFTQPYPVVSITLSDLDRNRVAMRRFRPAVYIPDAGVRAAGLAPGASAALMFEVADPGHHAVAFQFAFQ